VQQEAAKEAEKGEELKGLAVSVLRAYMAFELSRNTRETVEAGGEGARAAVAVAAVLNAALEHEPPLPHEVSLSSLFLSLSRARAAARLLSLRSLVASPLPSRARTRMLRGWRMKRMPVGICCGLSRNACVVLPAVGICCI
jgi:hypothetical protein